MRISDPKSVPLVSEVAVAGTGILKYMQVKSKADELSDDSVAWEGLDHKTVLWLKTTSVSTLEKSLDSRNCVSSAAMVALVALRSTAMAAALSLRMRPFRRVSVC